MKILPTLATLFLASTLSLGCATEEEVGSTQAALTNADFGDPIDINFGFVGPNLVVTEVLVDVRNRWLRRGKFFVEITINGFNAGPHEHGSQLFNVKNEATVFEAFEGHSHVVFDYTADTENQAEHEDYTVCVQPMKWRKKEQVMRLIGEPHCQVFSTF